MGIAPHTIELLEPGDVARELGLSYGGVRSLILRGKIQPYMKTRRGVNLFRQEDVERLRKSRAGEER